MFVDGISTGTILSFIGHPSTPVILSRSDGHRRMPREVESSIEVRHLYHVYMSVPIDVSCPVIQSQRVCLPYLFHAGGLISKSWLSSKVEPQSPVPIPKVEHFRSSPDAQLIDDDNIGSEQIACLCIRATIN